MSGGIPGNKSSQIPSKFIEVEKFDKYLKEIDAIKGEKGFNTCLSSVKNLDLCLKIFPEKKHEKCAFYLESSIICLKNMGKFFE